jgi:hypothetical protein
MTFQRFLTPSHSESTMSSSHGSATGCMALRYVVEKTHECTRIQDWHEECLRYPYRYQYPRPSSNEWQVHLFLKELLAIWEDLDAHLTHKFVDDQTIEENLNFYSLFAFYFLCNILLGCCFTNCSLGFGQN